MKENKKSVPIISTIIFIITLVVNFGSMQGWFGGVQREISDKYRNFITPEPFTFSIWSVIYTLIIVFIIYQFYLLSKNRYDNKILDKLNQLFIISCILNISWNLLWVNDLIGLSTVCIFLFTIVLGLANKYILKNIDGRYSLIIPIAFALYFGWLTVATVTNVAAFLVKINWNMFGLEEHLITCLMYIIVALLAGIIVINIKNPIFNLPIIWAFIGIYMTVTTNPPSEPHFAMKYVIIGVIVVLAIEALYVFLNNDKSILPQRQIHKI